jgi:hypothetical protein
LKSSEKTLRLVSFVAPFFLSFFAIHRRRRRYLFNITALGFPSGLFLSLSLSLLTLLVSLYAETLPPSNPSN